MLANFAQTFLDKIQLAAKTSKVLPAAAAAKLYEINQRAEAGRGACRRTLDNLDDLRDERARAMAVVDNLKASDERRREGAPRDVNLVDALQKISVITPEIDRLTATLAEQQREADSYQELARALNDFVARLPKGKIAEGHGTSFLATMKATLSGPKDMQLAEAIEKRRRRLRELTSDIDATQFAPIPSSEAKVIMRKQVAELAELGRPNISDLVDTGGLIVWPTKTSREQMISATGDFGGISISTHTDVLSVLAWFDPAAMIARLDRDIDEDGNDEIALTAAQRAEQLATIKSDMLANEREEEAFIEQVEATGMSIMRRPDADPRAVLGLASEVHIRGQ